MESAWKTHDVPQGLSATQLPTACEREWLLTNGTGAFAMGTTPGINTRRYHALLITTTRPPVGRVALVNQMLEEVIITRAGAAQKVELSSCQFHGEGGRAIFTPRGFELLRGLARGTSFEWTYHWGDLRVTRSLHLHWRAQAATLRYSIRGLSAARADSVMLRLGPLMTLRDFHSLLRRDATPGEVFAVTGKDELMTVSRELGSPLGRVSATLRCAGATFRSTPDWWYGFHYPAESARGQDDREDCFLPGWFERTWQAGGATADEVQATLTIALGGTGVEPCDVGDRARVMHLTPIVGALESAITGKPAAGSSSTATAAEPIRKAGSDGSNARLARILAIAADDFVARRTVRGKELSTIIAGYPWFADWGRDTFIALPGLLLTTGRFEEARSTFRAFAEFIRDGLVPNVFDDYRDTAAHYNTVDASLWFIRAALLYVEAAGDQASWDEWLCGACLSIMDAYTKGVSLDDQGGATIIRAAGDGLITAGSSRTQLTWMDAARDGVIFTPRHGKAVEINALWYHALVGLAERIDASHPQKADHFTKLASRIKRSFAKVFWNEADGCLYDTVSVDEAGVEHPDASIRPNQVLIASLPHSPLPKKTQEQVMRVVRDRLLTPYGLRTLPVKDAHYHGRYAGNLRERDEAYHQGTIWPWLIGPYAEAVLRLGKFSAAAKAEARAALEPLIEELAGRGLGQLHEVYEADEPHRPEGAVAQAWSVAEVIRVLAMIEA